MNWNHNATPFIPSMALNDQLEEYTPLDLAAKSMGPKDILQIELLDNSMYDRYYKDDIISIKMVPTLPPSGEGLIRLPDDSVIFRAFVIHDTTVSIGPLYDEFGPFEEYEGKEVEIIGIASGIIRTA